MKGWIVMLGAGFGGLELATMLSERVADPVEAASKSTSPDS